MAGSYKPVERETTIGAAVGDAFSEFQSLQEEMQETADNMSGANMEHLPKYETAEAAASELENHEEVDVPESLAEKPVKWTETVHKSKWGHPSRAVRLSNAQAMLQAVIDVLEDDKSDDAEQLREE